MSTVSLQSKHAAVPITEPPARITSHPFQAYLDTHHLSWLAVAREAEVLCLTVWNIAHGLSVPGWQAMRVRVAVHRLTGEAYTGPMLTEAGPTGTERATRKAVVP